jgi:hypothetical protein
MCSRVRGRRESLFVVARELEIVALTRHAYGDAADAGPGVELMRRAVV